MLRGLKHLRTMRGVRCAPRSKPPKRQSGPSLVRESHSTVSRRSSHLAESTRPFRAWVFSKVRRRAERESFLLVKRTREPEVNLFNQKGELIVLADLPNVPKGAIDVRAEGDLLVIEGVSRDHAGEVHYYKEVMLPCEVSEDFKKSYKSGILELHLQAKASSKPKGPFQRRNKKEVNK